MKSETLYYLAHAGATSGPFTFEQLRNMWNAGRVTMADHVCIQGDKDNSWVPISRLASKLQPKTSNLRILPVFLLCFFFGCLGIHRFYVGKDNSGWLMLFTLGGFGLWWLVDFISIICGTFRDCDDLPISLWT